MKASTSSTNIASGNEDELRAYDRCTVPSRHKNNNNDDRSCVNHYGNEDYNNEIIWSRKSRDEPENDILNHRNHMRKTSDDARRNDEENDLSVFDCHFFVPQKEARNASERVGERRGGADDEVATSTSSSISSTNARNATAFNHAGKIVLPPGDDSPEYDNLTSAEIFEAKFRRAVVSDAANSSAGDDGWSGGRETGTVGDRNATDTVIDFHFALLSEMIRRNNLITSPKRATTGGEAADDDERGYSGEKVAQRLGRAEVNDILSPGAEVDLHQIWNNSSSKRAINNCIHSSDSSKSSCGQQRCANSCGSHYGNNHCQPSSTNTNCYGTSQNGYSKSGDYGSCNGNSNYGTSVYEAHRRIFGSDDCDYRNAQCDNNCTADYCRPKYDNSLVTSVLKREALAASDTINTEQTDTTTDSIDDNYGSASSATVDALSHSKNNINNDNGSSTTVLSTAKTTNCSTATAGKTDSTVPSLEATVDSIEQNLRNIWENTKSPQHALPRASDEMRAVELEEGRVAPPSVALTFRKYRLMTQPETTV